jgi:hypothetical protein
MRPISILAPGGWCWGHCWLSQALLEHLLGWGILVTLLHTLMLLLALASLALAGSVRCQPHPEPTLHRLRTLCNDGTRGVSTWSAALQLWTTTVTRPPGQTCMRQVNPKTRQGEGQCH